jgi:hypothetical protein
MLPAVIATLAEWLVGDRALALASSRSIVTRR